MVGVIKKASRQICGLARLFTVLWAKVMLECINSAVRSAQNDQQTAFLFLQWLPEARHGYDGDI